MKNLQKIKFGICFKCIIFFIFFSFNNLHVVKGQDPLVQCEEKEYEFIGIAGETLCETHENTTFSLSIGSGTSYEYASQLSQPLTGNIEVVGDFIIDVDFVISGAVLKMDPDVTIEVANSKKLNIQNSQIFACDYLWKGIELLDNSLIHVSNSTIEDAQAVIFVSFRTNVVMDIINNTFNRNKIGIYLGHYNAIVANLPIFLRFQRNNFTCTAPLNGTIDEIGFTGIQTDNVPVSVGSGGGTHINFFENLIYGIKMTGINTYLAGRRFHFNNIAKDCISMEYGSLNIRDSKFENFGERGININQPSSMLVDNSLFSLDNTIEAYPVWPIFKRKGIHIGTLKTAETLKIQNSKFDFDILESLNFVYAISILNKFPDNKGSVKSPPNIQIVSNEFHVSAEASAGIYLEGEFPPISNTVISQNEFKVNFGYNELTSRVSAGIFSTGNKNNLYISSNDFSSHEFGNEIQGIYIENNQGQNIQITDNYAFFDKWSTFLITNDADNLYVCTNNIGSSAASRGFDFRGVNKNTQLMNNTIIGTGAGVNIGLPWAVGFIGQQQYHANEWYDIVVPIGIGLYIRWRSSVHARCSGCEEFEAELNKFLVHTPQTEWNDVPPKGYTYFSEYHRENIQPDDNDEFFEYIEESSPIDCGVAWISTKVGELDIAITDTAFTNNIDVAIHGELLQHSLYKFIKDNNSLIIPTEVDSFITVHDNTNIGKLYDIYNMLDSFTIQDVVLDSMYETFFIKYYLFTDSLYIIDNKMDTTSNSTTLGLLKNDKSELLDSIRLQLWRIDSINTILIDSLKVVIEDADDLNDLISPQTQFESKLKTINSIRFNSVLNNNGLLLESEITQLENIFLQDVDTASYRILNAYYLLPDCIKALHDVLPDIDLSNLEELVMDTVEIEEELGLIQEVNNFITTHAEVSEISVVPNPGQSEVLVSMAPSVFTELSLYDMSGKKLINQTFGDGTYQTILSVNQYENGMYVLLLTTSEGNRISTKLHIQKF